MEVEYKAKKKIIRFHDFYEKINERDWQTKTKKIDGCHNPYLSQFFCGRK